MLQRHEKLAFAGSIHFVTTVTGVRGGWFVEEKICREILEFFEWYRAKYDVDCFGYVLMPDHLHALLVQRGDAPTVSLLMKGFKQITSRRCQPKNYPGQRLWHARFDDVSVPGSEAARTKLNYIHNNPVKRELALKPEDYLWSSAREYFGDEVGIVKLTKFTV